MSKRIRRNIMTHTEFNRKILTALKELRSKQPMYQPDDILGDYIEGLAERYFNEYFPESQTVSASETRKQLKALAKHAKSLARDLASLQGAPVTALHAANAVANRAFSLGFHEFENQLVALAGIADRAEIPSEAKCKTGQAKNLRTRRIALMAAEDYFRITHTEPTRSNKVSDRKYGFLVFLDAIFSAFGFTENRDNCAREAIDDWEAQKKSEPDFFARFPGADRVVV